MTDLNEKLAQEAAELINGGEWRDGKWYSDGQRDAWRRALRPAADRIDKLEEEIGVLFATSVRLNSRADLDKDGYADRIEKLEAALRFIAGPSTVEFVDGTYEISETKMLSTYRRRAKRALEGNYDD